MGTSNWQNIPFCIDVLMKVEPKRVLDVGVGFGRWGMIVREFCDVWFQRVFKEDWAVHIEGIEAFPKLISDYHAAFYNQIHVGDAAVILDRLADRYDVTMYGDVLEHFSRDVAMRLLNRSVERSDYVLVNIPLGKDYPQEERYGNAYERHQSTWEIEDFQRFPLMRHALFHDYCGRPFGSFCLSREDPRDVKTSLFSEKGEEMAQLATGLTSPELQRLAERVAELAGELEYTKRFSSFRRVLRFRRSGAWNAIRWLRNRNRGVVSVRALGRGGAESKGTEVWLLQARPNPREDPIPWEFLEPDGTWMLKASKGCAYGRCLVSPRGRLRVPVDEDPELEFLKHPWSGQAEVAFRGHRQIVDLYAPQGGSLKLYPARMPMLPAEPRTREVPPAAPENGKLAARAAEDAFIESARRDAAAVIAVHCPRWLGITTSTRALFKHTYAMPDLADVDPSSLTDAQVEHCAGVLAATGVKHIVISGGDECHLCLVDKLKEIEPKVRVDLLWHGSYSHFQEDYAWGMLKQWIAAAREGSIFKIGVLKKGMEEFLKAEGLRTQLVLNYVDGQPEPPPAITAEGHHLGLWLSGVSRWKVPYAMLASLKMVPHARLHAAGLDRRCQEVIAYFRIPVEVFESKPLPAAELLRAIQRTHLTMYVTFSECCPMLPLESMRVGVPCLIGPTSHLFEDNPYLFERLVVPFPDRADVIARFVRRALEERADIMEEYGRFIKGYNAKARESLAEFLA